MAFFDSRVLGLHDDEISTWLVQLGHGAVVHIVHIAVVTPVCIVLASLAQLHACSLSCCKHLGSSYRSIKSIGNCDSSQRFFAQ